MVLPEEQIKKQERETAEQVAKRHGLKKAYAIFIPASNDDEREYTGWIRTPTISEISAADHTAKTSSGIESNLLLLKTCWLEGDAEILEDIELTIPALNVLSQIFGDRVAQLKKF